MSTDPYVNTSTVKNILQHVISPKIVNDGNGGYVVKTDLVNIDNVTSATTTTSGIIIDAVKSTGSTDYVQDMTINVNSGSTYVPRWAISHKTAESGGSTGSDLCIHRFADNGTMDEAINIQRSNFSTTVKGALTVNGSSITAPVANVTCNTINATTSIQTPNLNVPNGGSATINGAVTTTSLLCNTAIQFPNSGAIETGQLVITGKFIYQAGGTGTIGFGTNSSTPTLGSGFLRMTDSAGGIGFGDGTTTGGVVLYGPNSVPTSVSGFATQVSGTTTFGTNSSSLAGNAVFNNLQAGIISWTGNSLFGTKKCHWIEFE